MTYEDFVADEIRVDATLRNIEIIGEAAGNLPDKVTAKAPEIPWRLIVDMATCWRTGTSAFRCASCGTPRPPDRVARGRRLPVDPVAA
jgi:hypothetical protein